MKKQPAEKKQEETIKDEDNLENLDDAQDEQNVTTVDEEDEISDALSNIKYQIQPPKDTPLERRALIALEKQLEYETPESRFDIRVSLPFFHHYLEFVT